MAEYRAEAVIKKILKDRTPGPPRLPKEKPFGEDPKSIKLPQWFTEEDLKYYANKYEQKSFTGRLNYYRGLDLKWELTAAWTGAKVRVPVKFMVGDVDMVYTTPGVKEYGGFKNDEDTGHFINQERR
ncbi:hypothetical protein SASPL_105757 [Salvia splendens]|uniref:Epoxide hydrolase n=1 Tax=Salvia splendens TaxID=180675 RepID=A0A8X8YQ81_SALSN|nr:hypothetical protein SASPL_105757 [Salvia splendens]